MGRQLPGSDEKNPHWMTARGIKPYTWPEYAGHALLPIPVEEPIMEALQAHGMGPETASFWVKLLLRAGTGVYVGEDQSYGNK
jgi:hypothetical protein